MPERAIATRVRGLLQRLRVPGVLALALFAGGCSAALLDRFPAAVLERATLVPLGRDALPELRAERHARFAASLRTGYRVAGTRDYLLADAANAALAYHELQLQAPSAWPPACRQAARALENARYSYPQVEAHQRDDGCHFLVLQSGEFPHQGGTQALFTLYEVVAR